MRRVSTVLVAAACSSTGTQTASTPTTSSPAAVPASLAPTSGPYNPVIDPANFVATVDNPFYPLTPGTTYVYKGMSEGEVETDTINVTTRTKVVMGVTCIVVEDVVRANGKVAESTFDWYAQDKAGNVWYFGEDSTSYEGGKASKAGSWEGGVDGALPGIIMPAAPKLGDGYRQEYYKGEAEDMAEVVRLDGTATVPYGTFKDLLVTKDFTPLDPSFVENKYYASGIGVVFEHAVKGASEVLRLVSVKRA